jgi:hypothetical protein
MLKKYNLACYLLLGFWLIFFDVSNTSAAETVGQNIALGKSYAFSQAPNYSGVCTEAGDSTQLTDGTYVGGHLFDQVGAVCWVSMSGLEITFDLGEVKPLEGLALNTVAGWYASIAISWPPMISMLASDDGVTWYALGNLPELDMNDAPNPFFLGTRTHQYKTMSLATHGRYVKLVAKFSPYFFIDEVEIYRGPDENLALPFTGTGLTDIPAYLITETVPAKLRTRLHIDSQRVNQEITAANFTADIADPLRASLTAINQQIPSLTTIASPTTFKTIFPINDLHRQIFVVQAAVWRALGLPDIVAWKSSRYDPLTPTDPPTQTTASIDVAMMNNEHRADVINLSNSKASATDLTLTIEGLPGGDNPAYVTVHEVPFTDTYDLVPVAAALPIVTRQNGQYKVNVSAGLTKQIWLEFHPAEVAAGTFQGRLKVEGSGITTFTIPINLAIYPVTFPDKPTLHLGVFDSSNPTTAFGGWNMGLTANNRKPLIANIQAHYVDTTWAAVATLPGQASGPILPIGSYDGNGHLTVAPDPAAFNAWVAEWPNASNYFVWSNQGNFSEAGFAGFAVGTTEFKTAVKEWTAWWAAYLESQHIAPSKLGINLVDEPKTSTQDDLIIAYGEAIRSAGTEIKIFVDPAWLAPNTANPRMFEVSDILSPHLPNFVNGSQSFKDFYAQQRVAGRELWFYWAGGPNKSKYDPYIYERLAGWLAWQYGAKGIQDYAIGDFGYPPISGYPRSTWNDYVGNNYSPLFIDRDSVTDAKYMEALREGVEDYEYLKMLQDKISFLEVLGIKDSAIDNAKILLETGVTRTTSARKTWATDHWDNIDKDRTVADQVRIEILESLKQLNLVKMPDPSASIFAKDSLKVANKKVTFGQAKKINTKSKTISFKGANSLIANGSVQLYRGGTLVQTATTDTTGAWSIKLKEKKDTTVTFYLRYLDGAGVELGTSAGYKIKIDTQKPKITNLPIFLTKAKGAKIWWEAKDNIKVTSYKISFLGKTKTTKSKAFTVPLDAPSGLHILTLKAYDAMGNSTSRLVTVRVK